MRIPFIAQAICNFSDILEIILCFGDCKRAVAPPLILFGIFDISKEDEERKSLRPLCCITKTKRSSRGSKKAIVGEQNTNKKLAQDLFVARLPCVKGAVERMRD